MGIRFKLFMPVFLAFGVLAGVLHFYWVPNLLAHQKGDFIRNQYAVLVAMEAGLGKSLLVNDLAAVHATLDQQMDANTEVWKQLVLRNAAGKVLYPLVQTSLPQSDTLLDVSADLSLGGANIATLDLIFDWGIERDEFIQWARSLEYMMLIIFAVIVTVTFVWQNRWIRLPLMQLQSATTRLSAGDFNADLPRTGADELGKLTSAFRDMQDSLKDARQELQQALAEVSNSETRLRTILDTVADAIIVTDDQGVIKTINPATEEMFGYSHAEACGRNVAIFFPENNVSQADDAQAESSSDNSVMALLHGDRSGMRRSGELFPVEISFATGKSNESDYVVGVVRDISARKKVENDLLLAKNEADKASQAKSEFLSHMSHELRTPLNAILGFSQLLAIDLKDEKDKQSAEEIIKAGEHLLALIGEVLDLSRIESGKLELSIETVSLNDVLSDCRTLVEPMANEREIQLIDRISTQSDWAVSVDYNRLKQVFLNLMSNAVKYNRQGGSVTLDCKATDSGRLRISVTDTGQGLTEKQQALLYKPFERAGADKSNIEGAGIGLVITKHLVEMMGGQVGFESKDGQGSCFWFDINLAADGQAKAAAVKRADARTGVQALARTILYVEDNPANLRLVSHLIEARTPHVMLSAPDASLGLSLARAHKPDLILMDINLPGMNGFEAMARLQDNEHTRHIPVIAVSANAMRKDVEMGKAAGFCAYITKPFNLSVLIAEIGKALRP